MFARSRSQYRHHRQSPNGVKANLEQGIQYGVVHRTMGPPFNYPPQPVEIEPGSYPRIPGSYSSWEAAIYPTSSIGTPDSSITSNAGLHRIGPIALDLGMRNLSQDPLSTWWSSSDSPWVARGAVPDPTPEDRIQTRGYSSGHRGPSHTSPYGGSYRLVNPSDPGSAHFRVPPSDSGYGTILGPESASVRDSDIHDHIPDNQSIAGRGHEVQQYHEGGNSHEVHEGMAWSLIPQNLSTFHCDICQKPAKTKSELKKHKLRHTKPFRCTNGSCTRADGFSTINDLERHIKCKHPNDLPEGNGAKTYHCLVIGCKASGKTWPRLDNFKSHLKRVHGLRDENTLEIYVHRALMDQRINKGHFLQGKPTERTKELDQEDPIIGDPDDYPSLPWDNDPDWTQSSLAIDRQEILDPLIELPSPQDLAPSSGECLMGIGGAQEQAECVPDRASDLSHGCLEKETKLSSTDVIGNAVTSRKFGQGSPEGSLPSEKLAGKGKTFVEPTEPQIDLCLRDAIAAALSRASTAKDVGSNPGSKSTAGNGEPTARAAAEVVSCKTAGDLPLPNPVDGPAGSPGDHKPGSDTSNALEWNKIDLTDRSLSLVLDAIKNAGYIIKKNNQSQAGVGPTADHSKSGAPRKRDQVSCTLCTNFRGRPCEVKKHMKRHDKPYGCTYKPECNKKFGSKNDWKRHENSQHYQHESWLCDERGEDGALCGRVFYTADNARPHFTKIHKVNEIDAGRKLEQRRIRSNNQDHFFCGFCEKDIKLTEKGLEAWNQRFNHIDDHFMGRNGRVKQTIAEWKPKLERARTSPKSFSSNEEEVSSDSSTESSPSSSVHSSDSRDPSPQRRGSEKRKRESGDEQQERPAKQSKHGKHELRIFCCHCNLDFNPRTEAACPDDGHIFCEGCERKQVPVRGDHGGERR